MELVVMYPCPQCGRQVPLLAPVDPAMARCDACQYRFPVAPVDEKTVRFLKTITGDGQALTEPGYGE
jgi:DNA-directed RNA polymerase subunit RPC12/RpoP